MAVREALRMYECPCRDVHGFRACVGAGSDMRWSVVQVAEKLYQQGILSYPRTETDKFKEGSGVKCHCPPLIVIWLRDRDGAASTAG